MTVYIKVSDSICVKNANVKIKDIASIYCSDKDVEWKVKDSKVHQFPKKGSNRKSISILVLIEKIKEIDKTLEIVNLGAMDFLVYYHPQKEEEPAFLRLKICLVAVISFFGAAFTIMAYNTDVGINELFDHIYELTMGMKPTGPNILHISYSIGLAIGIIVFFNHVGRIKLTKEPTPFEVQMKLYETDVNNCILSHEERKKEEKNVSS